MDAPERTNKPDRPKSRLRRVLGFLALISLAFVIGIIIAGYVMVRLSVPVTGGELAVPGISATVEITYDSLGIAQVWAESEAGAFFALGYLHAADRMFQMDLIRRVATGRLSEMIGSGGLELDILQRSIDHRRIAREAAARLGDEDRARLQAYAEGVNAYKAGWRLRPFEYYFVPEFEPWTAEDCLTVLSFQTWYSDALQNSDEAYVDMIAQYGLDTTLVLLPPYPDWAPVTVPEAENEVWLPQVPSAASLSMTYASNSWVVSPSKSASGRAMLAADPHLELSRLPQFWYAVGLHASDTHLNVVGVTVPGLPYVVMGHNGVAAWSFTAGGVDVTDWYEERMHPDDSSRYLTADGDRSFEVVGDSIGVRGGSPHAITIRRTVHGPVLRQRGEALLAFRWAGFDIDLTAAATAGFDLHHTCDFEGFRRTVTSIGALDANWLYADSGGNIGYQLGTPVPVRVGSLDYIRPIPGWTGEGEWQGYLPLERTPHGFNPARGFLASCNNKPELRDDIPGSYVYGRIMRITHLLDSASSLTPDDMRRFQLDRVDANRLLWRGLLADALRRVGDASEADSVAAWDGDSGPDSRVTVLFTRFLRDLKARTFADKLPDGWVGLSTYLLDRVYLDHDTAWCDDIATLGIQEGPLGLLDSAAATAVGHSAGRTWGEIHFLAMQHPLASVPVVGTLLDLSFGPWPWGGTPGTLWASFYRQRGDSSCVSIVGPSLRFVVDFADPDAATLVLPAGNSGNPASPHFFDFFERYRTGEDWVVPFSREAVARSTVSTLTLAPAAVAGE